MNIELVKDLNNLLETFFKHRDGYEKASTATDDKELQRVLKSISEHKEISATDIQNILKNYSDKTEDFIDKDSVMRKRNLSKILSSFFENNDNKFIIEACLIRESSLNKKLELLINKNHDDQRLKMVLQNNIKQCIAIKSLLWEQSTRF